MIRQRQQPPDDSALPHLPLVRVPTRTAWKLAITCTEMLQVDTHYMGRRTLPCIDGGCPGCAANLPKRYEAYISALTVSPTRHVIVALTPRAAKQLWDSAENPRDLRGKIILLQRLGNRANGALTCRFEPDQEIHGKLPPIPELLAHMSRIWGIKEAHFGTDHPYYADSANDPSNYPNDHHGS